MILISMISKTKFIKKIGFQIRQQNRQEKINTHLFIINKKKNFKNKKITNRKRTQRIF